MTKFENKKFQSGANSAKFRDNWERSFSREPRRFDEERPRGAVDCAECGGQGSFRTFGAAANEHVECERCDGRTWVMGGRS